MTTALLSQVQSKVSAHTHGQFNLAVVGASVQVRAASPRGADGYAQECELRSLAFWLDRAGLKTSIEGSTVPVMTVH